MTADNTPTSAAGETRDEARAKVPDRAEAVLAYLRTHRTRDMTVIRAALKFPAVRDVSWALDHLHAAGLVEWSRNGRLVVRDGT